MNCCDYECNNGRNCPARSPEGKADDIGAGVIADDTMSAIVVCGCITSAIVILIAVFIGITL